jgi:hypothetical protein
MPSGGWRTCTPGAKTEYAVIRAYPFGARKALVDKLLDSKDPQQIAGYKDLMDEALNFDSPKGDLNAGQWIVVPKAAAEELRAHLSAMAPTTIEKAWSAGTRPSAPRSWRPRRPG